jgi:hypothetical protein
MSATEPQIDVRRILSGVIPVLIGLVLAEIVLERVRRAGRAFGEHHPLLAELARLRG